MNSSRYYLEKFVRAASSSVPPGSLVLDAGAGNGEYEPIFVGRRYESADLCTTEKSYGHITYLCDLASIPVEDARYDLVVCTQVLEHLPEPQAVLSELHRVLKPGGEIWMSAPLFYEEHEIPFDFFRYTRFGLGHLLEKCGFQVVSLEPLEGYLGTLSYQADLARRTLRLSHGGYGRGRWVLSPLFFLLEALLSVLSDLLSHTDRVWKIDVGMCKNYTVVAKG